MVNNGLRDLEVDAVELILQAAFRFFLLESVKGILKRTAKTRVILLARAWLKNSQATRSMRGVSSLALPIEDKQLRGQ